MIRSAINIKVELRVCLQQSEARGNGKPAYATLSGYVIGGVEEWIRAAVEGAVHGRHISVEKESPESYPAKFSDVPDTAPPQSASPIFYVGSVKSMHSL